MGIVGLLAGVRILVVDDHLDSRDVMQAMLEMCGGDVVVADSATAAIPALDDPTLAAIVSDIAMPERDGFWLLDTVRSLRPDVAVLAVTGHGFEKSIAEAGFDGHLRKPVEPEELCTEVRRAMQARRSR